MRLIIILLCLLITELALTQTPSHADIQNQMGQVINKLNQKITELEKQIADQEKLIADAKKNKEDPDTIRSMEENLNQLKQQLAMLKKQAEMMGGVTKGLSKMSAKTIKEGIDQSDNNNAVLKRDDARINALPKKTLTNAELAVFVQKVKIAIEKKLPLSQKKYAKELYDKVNAKEKSPGKTGNIAVMCWLAKSTDMAIWIMGKACMDDTTNTDNLSNYASFLSMVGGEQLAIPIQQNLLARFPNNTTLMNNLGQSWYGLGDLNNSKKYLGGTMMLMAAHPYAQETFCGIEEAENRTEESIESLKRSIKEDYTPEKEAKLEKLGYHVKFEDFKFKYPTKAHPLGIEKFFPTPPGYAFEGGEAAQINRMEWDDYREKIAGMVSPLQQTKKEIDDKVDQYRKKLFGNLSSQNVKSYKDVNVAELAGRVNPLLKPYNNKVYKTARRKYELLIEWHTERFLAFNKKMMESGALVEQLRNDYSLAIQNSKSCEARFAAATTFNSTANELWQQRNTELLTLEKEFLNARANYSLYASLDPSIYEQDILNIKFEILNFLSSLNHENEIGCMPPKDIPSPHGKELPDFDEMNCQYKTELSIPYAEKIFSIKVECNKMMTDFDLVYLKGSLEENLAHGTYHGEVEIRGEAGEDPATFGPLQMGAKLEAGVGVKFGNERAGVKFSEGGIEDVFVFGEAGIGAGPNENLSHNLDLPITPLPYIASLEGRISLITGNGSVSGHGALSGISIK